MCKMLHRRGVPSLQKCLIQNMLIERHCQPKPSTVSICQIFSDVRWTLTDDDVRVHAYKNSYTIFFYQIYNQYFFIY